jgi:hypothetical protein
MSFHLQSARTTRVACSAVSPLSTDHSLKCAFLHDFVASSSHKKHSNITCRILVKTILSCRREIPHLLSSVDRNRMDFSTHQFSGVTTHGYSQLISERVLYHLFPGSYPFCDDLQGGSVKIYYYHDVSRLIASMSFRSTSRKFPIHLRGFPFSLPSLPFSFCKVGNESWVHFSFVR